MSPNGFGISEVAEGIPSWNAERQFRVFRVMRCREATSRTGIISEAVMPKRSEWSERFRHNVRVYEKFRLLPYYSL